MKVLIVKLSSLGDVVHAMAAVQDMRAARRDLEVAWVVEKAFAPLVRRCAGVDRVVECELRAWRRAPWAAASLAGWFAFRRELRRDRYDAVIDAQGLTKSALVAWMARLAPRGHRYALANQTEGSSYEAPTRWVADVAVAVEPHIHAVERTRELCARVLGYAVPAQLRFGLRAPLAARGVTQSGAWRLAHAGPVVALVHGASRADKLWPDAHWLELGQRLHGQGFAVALPHGGDEEEQRAESLAARLGALGITAILWPRQPLDEIADQLAVCAGVIGVDSGLSHIAVALGLPHVQIYNHDTAWRTGPMRNAHQRSVYAQPTPGVDAVWQAWMAVTPGAA